MKKGQMVTIIPSFETIHRNLAHLQGRTAMVLKIEKETCIVMLVGGEVDGLAIRFKKNSLSEI